MAENIIQMQNMQASNEEAVNVALGRAAIYEYLSYTLQEPVGERFIGLSEKFLPFFKELADASKDKDFKEGLEILSHYVKVEHRLPKDEVLLKLNMQWTAIFLTGSSGFPYSASVALTKSKTELEAPWERVCEFYNSCGFAKPKGYNEAEDHISMELFCLFYLAGKEAEAIKGGAVDEILALRKKEQELIEKHIDIWLPSACDKLFAYCSRVDFELPLYKAVSLLTKAFLAYDKRFIQSLLDGTGSL